MYFVEAKKKWVSESFFLFPRNSAAKGKKVVFLPVFSANKKKRTCHLELKID